MFQFGIRSMLAVTFAAAGLFGAVFALPPELGIPLLTYMNRLLVPLFVAGVVYGRGYGRAFAIGGLAWYGLPMIFQEDLAQVYSAAWVGIGGMSGAEPDRAQHLLRLLLAGVSGLMALSVRYVSLGQPPTAAPAVSPASGQGEGAKPPATEEPRERLPYWLVPVTALLLLVMAMIGWLKVESGALAQPATTPAIWTTINVNGAAVSGANFTGQPSSAVIDLIEPVAEPADVSAPGPK